MEVKEDIDERDLEDRIWSGAKDSWDNLIELGASPKAIFQVIEDAFYDEIPTMGEVNDYLWFEYDSIKEELGLFDLDEKVNKVTLKQLRKDVEGVMKIEGISDELNQSLDNLLDQLEKLFLCEDESDFDDIQDEINDIREIIWDIVIENEEGEEAFRKDIQKNIIDPIDDDLFY